MPLPTQAGAAPLPLTGAKGNTDLVEPELQAFQRQVEIQLFKKKNKNLLVFKYWQYILKNK